MDSIGFEILHQMYRTFKKQLHKLKTNERMFSSLCVMAVRQHALCSLGRGWHLLLCRGVNSARSFDTKWELVCKD